MAKTNITQYSSTPSSNTDINNINIDENCPASGLNNAIRELMAHLKNVDTGSQALTALSVTGDTTISSGNLLVGKTSSAFGTGGIEIRGSDDASYFTRSGNASVHMNRLSSDGEILRFNKDSSLVGSIGVDNSDNLFIQGNSNHVGFQFASSAVVPHKNGATIDNNVNLGSASDRFKDLYLSGGAYLGGTGSANKLDDYEEGSGTLTITGTSGGTATTSGSADYQYTKIGNLVSFQFEFNCSSVSGVSGTLQIALPFTPSEYSVGALRCYLVTFDGSPFVETTTSVSQLRLRTSKTGSATQDILSTGYYIGEITYKTTA